MLDILWCSLITNAKMLLFEGQTISNKVSPICRLYTKHNIKHLLLLACTNGLLLNLYCVGIC